MDNIRNNGMVGLMEYTVLGEDKETVLNFSEWWSGDGLDFTFDDNATSISLHVDDLTAIVTVAIATGMIELKECKRKAARLKESSKARSIEHEKVRYLVL